MSDIEASVPVCLPEEPSVRAGVRPDRGGEAGGVRGGVAGLQLRVLHQHSRHVVESLSLSDAAH